MTAAQEDGGSRAGKLKLTTFSLLNVTAGWHGFLNCCSIYKNQKKNGAVMKKKLILFDSANKDPQAVSDLTIG